MASSRAGVFKDDEWSCFAVIDLPTGDMVHIRWDKEEVIRWMYTQEDFHLDDLRLIRGYFVSGVTFKPKASKVKPKKGAKRGKAN